MLKRLSAEIFLPARRQACLTPHNFVVPSAARDLTESLVLSEKVGRW